MMIFQAILSFAALGLTSVSGFTSKASTAPAMVDECDLGTDNCDTNASCENTDDHTHTHTEALIDYECTCNSGFTGDGLTCDDDNECELDTANCDDNESCENTAGSFECTPCESGFTGDGFTCADDNECELETDNCDDNASCENTDGSFECTCDTGFAGDGSICADINECSYTDDCDDNASCENTDGSFVCTCESGFTGDGLTCADVDECTTGICGTGGTCTQTSDGNTATVNTYYCACDAGYSGAGEKGACVDVDECTTGICGTGGTCTQTSDGNTATVNTYYCACDAGYNGAGEKGACVANTCTCPNGTPTVFDGTGATLCDVNGKVDCSVCGTAGYTISSTATSGSAETCCCDELTVSGAESSVRDMYMGRYTRMAGVRTVYKHDASEYYIFHDADRGFWYMSHKYDANNGFLSAYSWATCPSEVVSGGGSWQVLENDDWSTAYTVTATCTA